MSSLATPAVLPGIKTPALLDVQVIAEKFQRELSDPKTISNPYDLKDLATELSDQLLLLTQGKTFQDYALTRDAGRIDLARSGWLPEHQYAIAEILRRNCCAVAELGQAYDTVLASKGVTDDPLLSAYIKHFVNDQLIPNLATFLDIR